eukprot:COSAG04_NODE_382_length_15412_cov_4.959992_2_plen_261_part_00
MDNARYPDANPHSANDFEVAHRPVWYPCIDDIGAMRNLVIACGAIIVTICVGWSLFSEFSDSREKMRLQGEELAATRRELADVRLAMQSNADNHAMHVDTTRQELSSTRGELSVARQEFADMNKNMNDVHRRLAMVEVADKMKDMRANMPGSTAVSPDPASAAGQAQRRALQSDPGDHQGICLDPAHVAVAATDSAYAVSRAFSRFKEEELPLLARITSVQNPSCCSAPRQSLVNILRVDGTGTSWSGCRSRSTPQRWPT